MNENYINNVLGETTRHENYADFFNDAYQFCEKRKHKKGKKWKKGKKLKKRVKALEQQNAQIIYFLEIAAHQSKTPQANTWWQEMVVTSTPKLLELGTEVVKGINQSKAQSTNNELNFSTEKNKLQGHCICSITAMYVIHSFVRSIFFHIFFIFYQESCFIKLRANK